MRAGGLACALLLLASGASNALPQYGGAGLQQQQQEEGQVGQQQQEQQEEGGFWWQDKGVFESQGAVVGGTSGTTGGFTPTQSSECALGNGCVPWQYCLNGVYKFNPSVNLDVRSPAKVPEDVSQKLCGQIGNVCCPIPEDILLQQQLAQAGVGGGVVAGVPGAGVHAEQTSAGGAGAGVHAEQTSAGVGGAGGYGGSGGIISGTVSGGGVVGGGLEQTSSGGSGHTSGALSSQCRVGFDCVPSYQCDGGVINTSGVGLINIRTKVTKCTNPEYPTVEAVCCKVPGASEPTILACPAPEECVPYGQCKEDGTINTDGTGLLDVRINTPCHLDSVNYEKGVCCLPPRPEPLATCPNGLVCELEGQCGTPGALAADGTYTSCYTGSGATGICCEPKLPLDACPGDLLCRVEGQCSSPAAIDGSYAECYIQGGSGSIGVCCEPPAPLVTCPGELDCKLQEHCGSPGAINVDGSYTTCYVGGGTGVGICCEPIAPLQECPGGQQCKFEGQCSSPGALNADGSYATCYVGSGVSDVGICCEPPPPVDVCPGGRTCSDQCSDPTAANADGTYTLCNKPDGSGIGACCELAKIVDVCPADSVCLPEVLCQGEFLNQDDVFVSYATGVSWTKCPLSGNLDTPGICCRTPKPISYPTADTCGVRNYALDTRIKSPLAKNEAVFGEFPWQAIIFFTNYTYKCGASLVDERHLITGAHCVAGLTPNQIQVRLGEWQVNTYDEPLKYVDASVAEIALHPDFKGGSLHNDIALITLAEPVEFQFHINSVCVPDEEQVFGETYCFATGWGKDAFNGSYQVILKQVDLPLVDNYACQEKLRKTRLGRYFILDKSFVCAGGEEGKDACTGDGGGPLVCKDAASGLYFLKGITAWGISCGEKDVPGVYADVQYLRPWLNSVWGQTAQQVSGYGK